MLCRHIDNRGCPAPEPGGKTALVEIQAFDGICIECRLKAQKVAHLIHGYAIQKEKVVTAVSAVYIEA